MADERAEVRIQYVNEQLRRLVQKKRSDRARILLVEMQSDDSPQVGDLSTDGVHPNDSGYEKMAKKWFEGVEEAAQNRFI